jgi:hypothetical protein
VAALLTNSCGGDNKHLPSLNPPEYDSRKVYTAPTVPPSPPAASSIKPADPELPPIQLPSLEPGPNEKGEWRKVPLKPDSLQLLKGAKTTCEALSRIVQGLGSAQLFAGTEGKALKKSLGSQAESTGRMLDQQLAESMKQALGPNVANCPLPIQPRKSSSLKNPSQPARIVLTHGSSSNPLLLAQAKAPDAFEDGYSVSKTSQTQKAPPGWVGRKTTDRTTRVGNKPEAAGNRDSTFMISGGKVLQCPTFEGVAPGDAEFV